MRKTMTWMDFTRDEWVRSCGLADRCIFLYRYQTMVCVRMNYGHASSAGAPRGWSRIHR